ncbi:MAG: site-2 protease family protein [Desulfomonile tiedjei]|uniref:Site-2 protease family protein n=1 Tax=Desulfomonile tiedjei TaxID=2358 RepID=A0A9D6Z310_9BACT|nr:site-2 protease family protein [Desulfomonile tiedjei]
MGDRFIRFRPFGREEFRTRKTSWPLHIVLFLLTAVTTTIAGATIFVNKSFDGWLLFVLRGFYFSVPLMSILLVHEMGHYLVARRRLLDVTPPYFIPAIPPLGTFGAFIKIRSAITNLRVLVEVGASGPIAGAIVAIPLLFVGLCLSEIHPETSSNAPGFSFGSSVILELMCLIRFGEFSTSATIIMHPTAVAAWFGLFVTAMNLLPIGQLDGGHVIYALFGPRGAQMVSFVVFCCLIPMGILLWPGWLVFGILVLFLGLRHPPPLDAYTPLDRTGRIVGWTAVILFVLTFIPVPVSIIE